MPRDLAVELVGVEKTYGVGKGQTRVLRGVDFALERGDFVALVGQSGSGKSTLLNIIGGLDRAASGTVRVLGHDYTKSDDDRMARVRNGEIGFVFQHFNLLEHLDVIGNVALPAAFDSKIDAATARERAREALARVGLTEFERRAPSELSGGQKQRVAIARALFNRPALLLCDEPTGNLDSQTGRDVIEFFQQLNREDGTTLLIVTHEERVSRAASRVTRILDGAIVEGDDETVAKEGEGSGSAAGESAEEGVA